MNDTITIQSPGKELTFVVKSEFLQVINADPKDVKWEDIFLKFQMAQYVHNENGPAVISHVANGYKEYWLHGKRVTDPEQIKRIEHNQEFNNKFEEFLDK